MCLNECIHVCVRVYTCVYVCMCVVVYQAAAAGKEWSGGKLDDTCALVIQFQ
jgi:hypothetical protein